MKEKTMPVSVLEHVRGDKIPAEWRERVKHESGQTFKVVFIPDNEIENQPKRKVYSDDVKRIYREAMESLDEDVKNGLTREESFSRLRTTMKKIGAKIKRNEKHD